MEKYRQTCKHCNNVVVGEFSPSKTRQVLTSIAKKGGMKAVLAYVGSVFPGLGNVTGFLVGWGIDFIYGKDISKFIDKIADEIDDNKIYVFNCPQCGETWSCKEEDLLTPFVVDVDIFGPNDDYVEFYDEEEDEDVDEEEEDYEDDEEDDEEEIEDDKYGQAYYYNRNYYNSSSHNNTYNNDENVEDLSDEEVEYILEVKACLEEGGEISKKEHRLLEKLRIKLGISEDRADELEASLNEPQLTEEEMEYLEEYKECLDEGGTISSSERRLLNRLRSKLGISEERAEELEKLQYK